MGKNQPTVQHGTIMTFDAEISQLSITLTESIAAYQELSPIYRELSSAILAKLSTQDEMAMMEHSTLIKLLDMASKAQMQPISEFTKLIQAITSLQDISELRERANKLQAIIDAHESQQRVVIEEYKTPSNLEKPE
jgi:cell fate (sporulation/competence/biofilm development) regulator YlbF (YheA/YmcA/DUF963 family)